MNNSYRYVDPDYNYTDPKTGVLRNLENIVNADLLILFESLKVSVRLEELQKKPIKIENSYSLLDIHRYLFQDVYSWAGEIRTVEISKNGNPFFPLSHFNNAFFYIDRLIMEYRKIDVKNISQIAFKLAEILDNVNYLHPFREGNGRTQREFLRLLANEKGLILNLNPADNVDVYNRYMEGTINGNVEQLHQLIMEIITEK
ncbi:MAG: Fic family protein [Flavobacteriaceae bacterium]|nr:Fic family protein [Flavobacteriaceae bacterium]